MNTATQEVLDRLGKYKEDFNEIATFGDNGMGTIQKIDNQEILSNHISITTELPSLDPTIVRESFTGTKLAGEDLTWSWNHWGQLQCKLGKYPVKGSTLKAMYKEMLNGYQYIQPDEEISVDEKWSVITGTMLLGKHPRVKVLVRGETIIGIFKESTKVMPTIRWYEKAIYGNKARFFNKAHKTTDYRTESPNEVYDGQYPEFTKEVELEEIRAFIHSLRTRRLGNEEREVINDIYSELGIMVEGSEAQGMSDDELLSECIARGI